MTDPQSFMDGWRLFWHLMGSQVSFSAFFGVLCGFALLRIVADVVIAACRGVWRGLVG